MILKSALAKPSGHSHYIPIPDQVATKILEEFGKRVYCVINGKMSLHCAILFSKNRGYYIMVGKATMKKILVRPNEPFELEIKKDNSPYQAEVPEELTVVLETDELAAKAFDALTPGRQRTIIYHIGKAKHSETRITRALKITDFLKIGVSDLRLMK
ncbi:MAG: YdeI/OmpD-associated family protein [Saprospiraceae bacterium]